MTATPITLDLTRPYAREIAAHMLCDMFSVLAESKDPEVPAVDEMATLGFREILDPYLEQATRMGEIAELLRTVADPHLLAVNWPFGEEELAIRAAGCLSLLHESLDHTPTEGLEAHAAVTRAAREFVASLRTEVMA